MLLLLNKTPSLNMSNHKHVCVLLKSAFIKCERSYYSYAYANPASAVECG